MRIMVASDIHGSAKWARKIVEVFEKESCDRLLLLGDILYHGPRNDLPEDYAPKEVIAVLNDIKDKIMAVKGNCDAEVDQMVLKFPITAEYLWIESDGLMIYATHGTHLDPDNPPAFLSKGDILLSGHSHEATDEFWKEIRYMNPGSPSLPKNGTVPSYIIIDKGTAELKRF